jgi:uncharacterized phage protein (TIGR02218 family)
MKTLDVGFAAHLASGQTTLATCWKLTRTDSLVLGFTDHDEAIAALDTLFVPAVGFDGGDRVTRLGGQVDTTEVLGVLSSAAISETDIALGLYDGARVETWRINWRNPDQRDLLRDDTIGEITRQDQVFRAELRSAAQDLNRRSGRIFQHLCDARLGDGHCGVDLDEPVFAGTATVVAIRDRHHLEFGGLEGFAAGWFAFGHGTWASGARQGRRDGVLSHGREGAIDVVCFDAAVGESVEPGDVVDLVAGCDRQIATCAAKFDNVVNFRGFPHIPGTDYVLRHPRSGDPLDGRPVVK